MARKPDTQVKANAANALVQNTTLQSAWYECERACVEQLIALDIGEHDLERELVKMLRSNRMHQQMVEGFLATGDVDEFNKLQRSKVVV